MANDTQVATPATQEIGSQPSNEGIAVEGNPWEIDWGIVKQTVSQYGQALNQSVNASENPWEQDWGIDPSERFKQPVARSKPITNDFEKVFAKLIQAESRGRHTDSKGNLTTSSKGAKGISQVMARTGIDPGYGVQPLQNTSEEEYLRFGRDYLRAMVDKFGGDIEKAVAAYNAGPRSVDKAVEKGGDNWKDHLPKKSETLPYLKKILGSR